MTSGNEGQPGLLLRLARKLWAPVRIAAHALRSPGLLWRRYVLREPAVGSIPHEVKLHERYWERRFRSDTGGWVPVSLQDGHQYEGTPFLLLLEIVRHLKLTARDVFVDLGCGKGRALAMAALAPVGLVVGVEQSAEFLEVAQHMLASLEERAGKVKLFNGLAQQFDFDQATAIFLFNPFGARTMEEVLGMLRSSLERNPRRLRIIYANPVHEQVLRDAGWLENTETWPTSAYSESAFLPPNPRMVSFWEARPQDRAG